MSDIPLKMAHQHLIWQQEAFSDLFNGKPPFFRPLDGMIQKKNLNFRITASKGIYSTLPILLDKNAIGCPQVPGAFWTPPSSYKDFPFFVDKCSGNR